MARWGDNSAKGTKQKTQAKYVAGAAGVGAGVAGAGYGVARAGQKTLNARTAEHDTYESLRQFSRRHSDKVAQRQMSSTHIMESSKKKLKDLENAPSAHRYMAAHTALKDLLFVAHPNARRAAQNEVRNAARSASFKRDRESASRAYSNLRAETTRREGLSRKFKAATDSQTKLSSMRDAVKPGMEAAKRTRRGGRALMVAGAGIPLAALATSHKVARDWAPAHTRKQPKLSEMRPNQAYQAKPNKPVKLTSHQQSLLNNSSNIQDRGWSITAAEKRHQNNRAMQKPEGGWR